MNVNKSINLAKRKGLIRGIAHDPTAWAFGGVASDAGLFSVSDDLLNACTNTGKRVYKRKHS